MKNHLTNPHLCSIIYPVSSASGRSREYTEMYSRGRRGAPAKGVGRVNRRESSNLSISANRKATQSGGFFCWRKRGDLNTSARERERAERRRWRKKRRRASEQTRSIETDREQGDYVCEVRRREVARQNLSISANRKSHPIGWLFLLTKIKEI